MRAAVAASVTNEGLPSIWHDLERLDASSHEHLEAQLLRSDKAATKRVAGAADDRPELAVHRVDLLERVDRVDAGEHPGKSLIGRLEHVDDEASSLDEHVEELRQRIEEPKHLGGVTLRDQQRRDGQPGAAVSGTSRPDRHRGDEATSKTPVQPALVQGCCKGVVGELRPIWRVSEASGISAEGSGGSAMVSVYRNWASHTRRRPWRNTSA